VSAHREEHLDLCAARALGSIGEADRLELERHLAEGCPECERALLELSQGVERLAASAPAAVPNPRVRMRLLEQVRAEAAASPRAPAAGRAAVPPAEPRRVIELPRRRHATWPTWAFAAAAALRAVRTIAMWRTCEALRSELRATRDRVARAELDLAVERAWSAVATSPGARVVDFAPLQGGPMPRVRATYDPASRRAIVSFDNLATPTGSDFELWAILPDGPKSLGVVRGDATGHAEVRVPDAGDPRALSAFAISLEKEGGSPDPRKPAGPVILAGAVKS
jgi:anti-sigma-K factor RskA